MTVLITDDMIICITDGIPRLFIEMQGNSPLTPRCVFTNYIIFNACMCFPWFFSFIQTSHIFRCKNRNALYQ